MDERQREFLLREQLKTIQKELGEGEDAKSQEIAELREKIEKAGMPEEVEAHAKKELARLERMPEAAGEYSMARTYLEWLIELPWAAEDEPPIDIAEARRDPRRGPLRPAEDQAPHPRIPRDPQAEPERPQPDPVLCRAARRRQDLARARASRAPRAANSSASASAARMTRPRSAAIAAPISARCPATSCRASAAPAAATAS